MMPAAEYANIPAEMRSAKRWILHRDKTPYYTSGKKRCGKMDTPADEAMFDTFDNALRILQSGQYSGLGFALGPDGGGNHWQGIDFDKMPDRAHLRELAPLLPGYVETSPSGKGLHALGYGKPFDTLGPNPSGIECYAKGRYFTVTGEGASGQMLACLADFVNERLKPIHASMSKSADAAREATERALAASARESEATTSPDSEVILIGQRNDFMFRRLSALRGLGLSEPEMLAAATVMNAERCNPPLSDAEVKTIVYSACKYQPNPESTPKAPRGYRLLSGNDLANSPPMEWRIKGTLPRRGVGAISGPSGEGKSTLAIDMLHALAAGKSWFGYKTVQCPVIYCALEGQAGIAGRVAAYQAHHGASRGNIRFILQPIDIRNANDRTELVQAILAAGLGGGVLAIDTLAQAAPGFEENSGKDMGEVVAAAQELQEAINGVVLLVAHLGKDTSRGLRGHSSLHAALDAVLEVRRTGDRREWFVAKSKDGAGDRAHGFRLEVVTIGADADGDPITACVIEPETSGRAPKPPRGAWELRTLEVATEMAGGGETVTLPALIEIAANRTPHDPAKRDRRKELTKRAITDLAEKGHLTVIGEVVRLGAGNWFEPLADEDLI
ncbi:MAG: AAA family ATPase [Burkholderiales bacterium]